jgi:hypothetical protein
MARFMHPIRAIALLGTLLAHVGCAASSRPAHPQSPLIGRWTTAPRETEWGTAVIRLEFDSKNLSVEVRPTQGEGAVHGAAPYRAESDEIVSDALNGGRPTPYRIDGHNLILSTSEGPMTLDRVESKSK